MPPLVEDATPVAMVETLALRSPPSVRGPNGRLSRVADSLLPVFAVGEENRFVAFVCNAPLIADDGDTNTAASPEGSNGSPGAEFEPFGLLSLVPLLLIGPAGCGKSTLANHLAARFLEPTLQAAPAPARLQPRSGRDTSSNESSVWFLTGVDFARLYARAVEADDVMRFRRDLDRAAVVVIDDVHLMATKPASQDELASRIEFRAAEGRPTILTSRRLPSQVTGMRPLLVSRMLPGLTIPVRLPGPETRRFLLTEFARRRKVSLGDEELDLLTAGLEAELPARALDSAIAHVDLRCRMKGIQPDVHAVRNAIDAIEPTNDLSIDRVAKAIARRFKLRLADLKSSTRRQEVVRARSLAMYLVRSLTQTSYHQIGKYFGGRDHTTVLHACRKTTASMETDDDLRARAEELTEQLKTPG